MEFDFTREPGKEQKKSYYLKEMEKPLISIITPFFNAGEWIEQTFFSVVNQTFEWFEWIIVEDGSTEQESVQILKELGKRDKRIKIFYTENQGVSKARNYGVTKMKSDILVPLDADDLIVPTFLETLYWGLFFYQDASFCYTDNVGFEGQEYTWKKSFNAERIKTSNFLTNCGAIRRQDFLEVGGYTQRCKICHEDWILWLNLLSLGKTPLHLGYYGFWYRRNEKGRLNFVEKSIQIQEKKEAEKLTKEAAEKVKKDIQAIEFPVVSKTNEYQKPNKTKFSRKKELDSRPGVLFLIPWMEMGGADSFNLALIKGLYSKFRIGIMTTVPAKNIWRQKFEEFCDEIYELPSFLEVKNYAEFISYFIQTREVQILFLSNSYYGYYLLPCLEQWFPDLAVMDYVHMEEWYWKNGGYARISAVMEECLDKTGVCNEHTRNVMIKEFGRKEDTVETIYIGVDTEHFKNKEEGEKKQIQEKFGIVKGRQCILFPCRIHEQKRPFLMLEIADRIRKENKEIVFLVVGDGPDLESLKAEAEKRNLESTIYFTGRQTDMKPFYQVADITLICSIKEGLALTAYESCAMETPVISSDVGGQGELISEKTGWLIPFMQKEEEISKREYKEEEILLYVEAIKEAFSKKGEYQRKRKNCREIIEQKFSTQEMIKKIEKEFWSFIKEEHLKKKREIRTEYLQKSETLMREFITIYCEVEALENLYQTINRAEEKEELKRMMNSKWGKKLIQLVFKLRINRWFH